MKIRHIIVTLGIVLCASTGVFAQRFAYVNSEYILEQIPEYVSAQKQLDALSIQWQDEVDARFAEIESLYQAYQQDQVVLNEALRRQREDEIVNKEKEVKDYQRQKFGFEGDLFKERVRLIEPIQERVSKAIQAIAESQNLDVILDKNSEVMMLYANPRLDKSDEVIVRLGYKPGNKN
jgi:outer membrane protein